MVVQYLLRKPGIRLFGFAQAEAMSKPLVALDLNPTIRSAALGKNRH